MLPFGAINLWSKFNELVPSYVKQYETILTALSLDGYVKALPLQDVSGFLQSLQFIFRTHNDKAPWLEITDFFRINIAVHSPKDFRTLVDFLLEHAEATLVAVES